MAKSGDDLLKDAVEFARRTNVQFAIISTLLLVSGLNIERQASGGQKAAAEAKADAKDRSDSETSSKIAPAKPGHKPLVEERLGCTGAQKMTRGLEPCLKLYFRRAYEKEAKYFDKRLLKAQADLSALKTRFSEDQKRVEASKTREEISKASRTSEQASATSGNIVRFDKAIDHLVKRKKEIPENFQRLREGVESNVDFELTKGFSLGVSMALAPLFWLGLLLGLLLYLRARRDKFWILTADALDTRGGSLSKAELHDLPFWLAPAPTENNAQPDRLAQLVGWAGPNRALKAFRLLVFGAMLLVSLRIGWIGVKVASFVALSTRDAGRGVYGWTLVVITELLVAAVALALLWLLVRQPKPSSQAPAPDLPMRRRILVGAGAFAAVLVAAGQGGLWLHNKYFPKRPRRRNRPQRVNYVALGLQPGFYRNRNSSALYYVRASDGRAARAPASLQAGSLQAQPLGPTLIPEMPHRHSAMPRSGDLELAALGLWAQSRSEEAIDLLFLFAKARLSHSKGGRTFQSPLDLAAGIAMHDGLTTKLNELAMWARAVDMPEMLTRATRWTHADSASWRSTRWSPNHPLRWGGKPYTRKAA